MTQLNQRSVPSVHSICLVSVKNRMYKNQSDEIESEFERKIIKTIAKTLVEQMCVHRFQTLFMDGVDCNIVPFFGVVNDATINIAYDEVSLEDMVKKVFVVHSVKMFSRAHLINTITAFEHISKMNDVLSCIWPQSLAIRSKNINHLYRDLAYSVIEKLIKPSPYILPDLQVLTLQECLDVGLLELDNDTLSIEVEHIFSERIDELGSADSYNYEIQSEEISVKDLRKKDFKFKESRSKKKINKVVGEVSNLSKSDKKKLIRLLNKMDHQGSETRRYGRFSNYSVF